MAQALRLDCFVGCTPRNDDRIPGPVISTGAAAAKQLGGVVERSPPSDSESTTKASKLVTFIWAFFLGPAQIFASPTLREDLQPLLGPLICSQTELTPAMLWKHQVYDSNVLIQALATSSLQTIKEQAQSLAESRWHLGYAFGQCTKSEGWIASVPAPYPLHVSTHGATMPLNSFKSLCASISLDLAGEASTDLATLPLTDTVAFTPQKGILSLTCQAAQPTTLGPRVWFSVPFGFGSVPPQPFAPPFVQELKTEDLASFARWLTKIRTNAGLSPIEHSQDSALSAAAVRLASSGLTDHNQNVVHGLSDVPGIEAWRLLGEDRVSGRTLGEMVSLLWNSPRHRRLLLRKEATHVAFAKNGSLLVLLLARAVHEQPS